MRNNFRYYYCESSNCIRSNKTGKQFVVRFNTNGGSIINSQVVEKGGEVNRPDDPYKEGYEFIEWTLNNEVFDFDKKITKDITLNAHWRKNNEKYFTVEFNTNGGSIIGTQTVKQHDTVLQPTNPVKSGYTFNGWYLNNQKYDFNLLVTSNLVLEARWTKNYVVNNTNYKVSFVLENGTIINEQTVRHGNTVVAPANPIKENYEFVGWMTDNNIFNLNTKVTKNLVLRAVFQAPVNVNLACYTAESFNSFRPVQISHVQRGEQITCEVSYEAYQTHKIKEAEYELYFGNALELLNHTDVSNAQINGRAYKFIMNSPSNKTNIGAFTFIINDTYNHANLFIRLDNIKLINEKEELITKNPITINFQAK